MSGLGDILRNDEKSILSLRKLYEQYGYKKYKMSKFEEYDLYLENKSFLKSDNIITFNDPSGKLLALKPDITLSIVKNVKDEVSSPERVYYSENVYRTLQNSNEIKEIMQVGLEYIGEIDLYSICEVISLAIRSLKTIDDRYIMGISHMGLVSGILDCTELSDSIKEKLSEYISNKNAHDLKKLCESNGVNPKLTEKIVSLATIYGPFETMLPYVKALVVNDVTANALKELEDVYKILKSIGEDENLRLDFSIMNDLNYYNGIIFQGFIDEVPCSILSGGRYDNLLHRLGKKADAIGFAIYIDLLELYHRNEKEYDVEVLLLYDDDTDIELLSKEVRNLVNINQSVRVQKNIPENLKYKWLLRINNGRLEKIENN